MLTTSISSPFSQPSPLSPASNPFTCGILGHFHTPEGALYM